MATRIQLRRGTATQWTDSNPILAAGEPGVEPSTGRLKIGDGTRAWDDLPYASPGPEGPQGPAGPDVNAQLARTPETIIHGPITLQGGAPVSAAVQWPDGTAGVFTGTPSPTYPGALDSWTITYGDSKTYTQPTVTRNSAGEVIDQPAITEETS